MVIDNEKNMSHQDDTKSALWSILMTIVIIIIMAILKNYIG